MAFRAAGHGSRVHVLQFMKGGAGSVEDVRGEHNAIAAMPGLSYENLGHYGWHAMADGTDECDHAAEAAAGLDRASQLVDAAAAADLEVVLTGGHERPDYPADHANLVTNVRKETHPIDAGQGAQKGTEY